MAKKQLHQASPLRRTSATSRKRAAEEDGVAAARQRILQRTSEVRILDPHLCRSYIRDRQERGVDQYDEIWDGVYIVPPLATNPHQGLVGALTAILFNVITLDDRGQVFPGANVSDRRAGWDHNFRAPDIVVVLKESAARDCTTHWQGGPDFLVEVQSPRDDPEAKIPFYSHLQVRELLIIHRDSRQLRLYRHDGQQFVPVAPSDFQGSGWLVSAVVPLAFRRKVLKRPGPLTEVRRTDGTPGKWTV
jgi:Uma2 family endonuclease